MSNVKTTAVVEDDANTEDALIDRDTRLAQANSSVKKHMLAALGVGLVPAPMVDLMAVMAIQLKMLHSLANRYDDKFTNNLGKSLITALISGSAGTALLMPITSVIKVVPFVGQIAGAMSSSVVSGATTYAVGRVFIQHFESGGTMLTFNPEKMRGHFAREFEIGKTIAAEEVKQRTTANNKGQKA